MTYAAPIPLDEDKRLSRLHSLGVLDTAPEPIFDALTRMASAVCGVPIALLSLVDANRQWFKSNIGLDGVAQTPRDIAFCAHTILHPALMEVTDALQDPRFADNPLVTEAPHIRFYAGAPIVLPTGESVGTLCVIDQQAHVLSAQQRTALSDLALVAAKALDMRRSALELDRLHALAIRRAEEDSAKSALYHAIVEDQTDLISLALPSGELTFVNSAYAKHFGESPESMAGRNLLEYVAEKDRESVAAHLRAVCSQPGTAQGENQMRSASGEERWFAWSNRAIGNDQGQVIALHSVGRDITDRKRAELALKASQDSFRVLYEATPAMLHSIDPQGRLLHVSDTWLTQLGYTREEVIGRTSAEFLTPASRDYARSVVLPQFMQSGRCDDIQYQMVRKNGSTMDVLLSAVLERDALGQPVHSLAVIQDVTEKNAISRALRANEERLALATSANGIGIWEVDLATGRLDWSDTMFGIFGGTRANFDGRLEDWSSRLHPDDMERSQQAFQSCIDTGAPLDYDFRVVHGDGSIRHVNARGMVINDAQGKPSRVLGTNYDISERKEVVRALEHSEQRMRLIANNLPVLISHIDTDYRYTFTNDNYQKWFSLPGGTVGKTIAEVFGNAVFETIQPRIAEALAGTDVSFEMRNELPHAPSHMFVHYVPDRDENGKVIGVFGMVLDRSEQHQAQDRIEASERQLRAVTDNLPAFVAYADTQERYRFINKTYREWLGLEQDAILGRPVEEVLGPELYAQRRDALRRALQGERTAFEVRSVLDGVSRDLQTTYVPDVSADGEIHGAFVLASDVTELKRVEQELRDLSRTDTLTGLPNRRQFGENLEQALSRSCRTNSPMALMFLDVDHFKSINDSLGHAAGDVVLCEFAKRIRAGIRITDAAARLAGDEFVVILEDVKTLPETEAVVNKLITAVRQPIQAEGHEILITTSIGIAFFQPAGQADALGASELLARADRALYRAKAAGRNTFMVDDSPP
jgi:diguanylate cyclase (GGDEF)-like protein/PAS domain S-box-containing protein